MPTKKRAYHHGDLRRTLLEASVGLILERGLDELSLREVARRAGVSPAAPYHHFATRQDLLTALALDGFAMLAESMRRARAAAQHEGVTERFKATGLGYIQFALSHPAHFRLMFRPSLVPPEALPAEGAPGEAFRVLLDAVSEVLEEPSIRAHIDQRGLVLTAWSLVHGTAELLLDGPLARGIDDLGAPARDIPELALRAFQGLIEGLRAAPEKNDEIARAAAPKRRRTS